MKPSKLDSLYKHAMFNYEARKSGGLRIVGFRDDMKTIEDWYSYCMNYKPIPYADYLKALVDQANGDAPKFPPMWECPIPEAYRGS